MRYAIVNGEFQHLRINHQHAAVFRRVAIKQRQNHRIDAHRLAGARGSGNEQMRHARQIGDNGFAAYRFAQSERQRRGVRLEGLGFENFTQEHGFASRIWQLKTDRIAPRHDCGANARDAH